MWFGKNKKIGENYYENRYYKTKSGAQDAHEGIRPTYVELEPEKIKDSLTSDQYKLYRLIGGKNGKRISRRIWRYQHEPNHETSKKNARGDGKISRKFS